MHPSFSGLLVTCAYLPQTTLPPGVTSPSSPHIHLQQQIAADMHVLVRQSCKPEATEQRKDSLYACMAGSPACPSTASCAGERKGGKIALRGGAGAAHLNDSPLCDHS